MLIQLSRKKQQKNEIANAMVLKIRQPHRDNNETEYLPLYPVIGGGGVMPIYTYFSKRSELKCKKGRRLNPFRTIPLCLWGIFRLTKTNQQIGQNKKGKIKQISNQIV